MDFIEDHIINNSSISEELKLRLLYSEDMAPYSFMGALYHLSMGFGFAAGNPTTTDGNFENPNVGGGN